MKLYHCKHCGERFISTAPTQLGRCLRCDGRLSPVWMPEVPRAAPGTYPAGACASMEDFVAADVRRLTSRETDFGLYWRDPGSDVTYRAAWIEDTGELYVVQSGSPSTGGGHVEILAVTDRTALEAALEGWSAHCLEAGSRDWLRDRAAGLSYAARA